MLVYKLLLNTVSFPALNIKDHASIADWCQEKKISLVIVGPEDPLAAGIVDDFKLIQIHIKQCMIREARFH